jgi:glycosyltransferase involved in cell wall biosynthesis
MELLSESSYNLNLVLIGGDRGGRNQLQQRIDRLGITDQVHFLGNPSIDEKISVIQGARIALQPTLHEGFGMAILEALSCGTPVITSPNGAVEEVCGTAAHYTSATDINRMCADVESLWNDSELREEYSIKGRDRAENHFSLENGINQYKCILSELI